MGASLTCESVARAALGEPAKREGAELLYRCPHPERHKNGDAHPSLKINPTKDVFLCAPCGASGKAWALAAFIAGVDASDKKAVTALLKGWGLLVGAKGKGKADGRGPVVATYLYTDADGNPVARKLRFEPGAKGEKKDFAWQRCENGLWVGGLAGLKTPLYRLAEIKDCAWLVLTEGEKDADAGAKIGLPTTTTGAAGSFREDHADSLRGKRVVKIADADSAGRGDAQKVAALMHGKAACVKVVEIPGCKDLAEAIEKRMHRDALLALFEDAPEWKPASGAEILDSLMGFVRRFVSMTEAQARAVALWVAHTHAFDAADSTPYLSINSPEKQSGKTRLLEALRLLVFAEWFTGRVTAGVLTRKVDAEKPTLLLDESDAAFRGEETYAQALRGLLNTGYRRGGAASLCVGQGASMSYQDFCTFCPKAIAGIGRLPDTLADRSIPIKLKRAPRGKVERFRERDAERESRELQAKLAAWAQANIERLKDARPEIPFQFSDRQADVCEPLLAIADLVGGEWPVKGREALKQLCAKAQIEDDSTGARLLRDIESICYPTDNDGKPLPPLEEIPSTELAEALARIETSPWGEWSKGKPLSTAKLARLLKPFEIYPGQIKNGAARGYKVDDFQEAFCLYTPPESVKVSETRENTGENANLKVSNEDPLDTFENLIPANKDAPSGHFDTLKAGEKGKDAKKVEVEWEA